MKFPPIFFSGNLAFYQTNLIDMFFPHYLPESPYRITVVRRTFCMISVRSEKFKMTRNTAISAQVSLHSLRNKTNNEQGKGEKENS